MLWLDHKIFGNGYGMKTPHCDGVFFWVSGDLYTWSHGFGAQMYSRQWTHPIAGERRVLAGKEFIVFSSKRYGLRVEVAWSMVGLSKDINEANDELRAFHRRLLEL